MTQFEKFSLDYLSSISGEKLNKYLVIINGIVVTEVIENREQLDEAVTGALSVNPESEIQVYELIAYEPTATTTGVEAETEVEEVVETADESEVETEEKTVEVAEETSKDLPRCDDKFDKKAAKKAKKAAKLAKKAGKVVEEPLIAEVPMETIVSAPAKLVVKPKPVAKKATVVGATHRVAKLDKETSVVLKEYDSISEASEDTEVHSTNISKVCRGKRSSAGGFGWKYL